MAKLECPAKRDFSLRESVLFMAPKLMEMKELGFTTRELAAALAEQEIIIKAPTLNRYLSEYQAGRGKVATAEYEAADLPANKTTPHDGGKTMPAMIPGVSESGQTDRPKRFINVLRNRGCPVQNLYNPYLILAFIVSAKWSPALKALSYMV